MENFSQNVCTVDDPVTDQTLTIDCGKWQLCAHAFVCNCAATGCTVDLNQGSTAFDMQLSGNDLDGSMGSPGSTIGMGTVHFAR